MIIFKQLVRNNEFSNFMIHLGKGNYTPKFYFIHKYKNIKSLVKKTSEFQKKWNNYYMVAGTVKSLNPGFDSVVLYYLKNNDDQKHDLGKFIETYYKLTTKYKKIPFTISVEGQNVLAFWEGDTYARYYTLSPINYLREHNFKVNLENFISMIKHHREELLESFRKSGHIMYYAVSLINQYLVINPHFIINTVWYGNEILVQLSDYRNVREYIVKHNLFTSAGELTFDDVLRIRKKITTGSISRLINGDTLKEVSTGDEAKVYDNSLISVVDGYNYYRL